VFCRDCHKTVSLGSNISAWRRHCCDRNRHRSPCVFFLHALNCVLTAHSDQHQVLADEAYRQVVGPLRGGEGLTAADRHAMLVAAGFAERKQQPAKLTTGASDPEMQQRIVRTILEARRHEFRLDPLAEYRTRGIVRCVADGCGAEITLVNGKVFAWREHCASVHARIQCVGP
jgi:hypothetical protein